MIQTQVADRIATLTFHRPEKLNALGQQINSDSIATLRAWSIDPAVGVIVVTGSGRAFCAGGDVSNMAKDTGRSLEENIDGLRAWQELSWLLYSIPKVTIAAVNGFAMGAGLGVSLWPATSASRPIKRSSEPHMPRSVTAATSVLPGCLPTTPARPRRKS
jgi:2-(1,2-epoxy-1,2-dihydrophenyl)acetyl-CoA isomerase